MSRRRPALGIARVGALALLTAILGLTACKNSIARLAWEAAHATPTPTPSP